MIEAHPGYQWAIGKEESETLLKKCEGIRYLTRYSEHWQSYILTVRNPTTKPAVIKHYPIEKSNSEYKIRGKTMTFNSIQQLLEHYEKNELDPALRSTGIGKAYTEDDIQSSKCIIL